MNVREIRDRYETSMQDAKSIHDAVHDGKCASYDEAARYIGNLGLAIHIRPRDGETAAQAHDRWALARARES